MSNEKRQPVHPTPLIAAMDNLGPQKKGFVRYHASRLWQVMKVMLSITVFATIIGVPANIGTTCSFTTVSWVFGPLCSYLAKTHPIPPPSPIPPLPAPFSGNIASARISKETPIYVESSYSADDSVTAKNLLHNTLQQNGFTLVENQSDAKIIIDVEDVSTPDCPISDPTLNSQYDHLQCSIKIHVAGYFIHGGSLFDQPFSGNALEGSESLGQDGNSDLVMSAVENTYQHILSITKN